jgi:uncharacterized protein (DUF58 family)
MGTARGSDQNQVGRSLDPLQYLGRTFYTLDGKARRVSDATREPPDETLLRRRPLYLAAVFVALLSLVLRVPLLFIAGLLIFMMTFVPELWYRFGLRAVYVDRRPAITRAAFGDVVEIGMLLENRKPLPLPWIELADEYPDSLPIARVHVGPSAKPERVVLSSTTALWAYQRLRRRYQVLAAARGAHTFGPLTVRTGDPFGILTREVHTDLLATLLIHPIIAPLEHFGLEPSAPFGEMKSRRRVLEDPLRVAGVRAYAPGDEPRRIHWKATARTGELQSKVYEHSTRHTLAIFLDVRTFTHAHMGYDAALAELAICAAASVARWGVEQRYSVGLFSNGALFSAVLEEELAGATVDGGGTAGRSEAERVAAEIARYSGALRLRVPPSSRPEQVVRILDGLARTLPYHGKPMTQVLAGEQGRLPLGSTVVFIGAESLVDVPLIVALRRVRSNGHSVSLLLTQGTTSHGVDAEGSLHLSDLDIHYIGGRQRWEDLVTDVLGSEHARRMLEGYGHSLRQTFEAGDRGDRREAAVSPGQQSTGTRDGTEYVSPGAEWHAGQARPLVVE